MKKFLIIFILILVVGCGNKKEKLVCNYKDDYEEDTVTVYFNNNISTSYEKKGTMTLDDNSYASNYILNNYDSVEVVDKNVSMYVSENIDDLTKSEVKSLYEKMGYVCK